MCVQGGLSRHKEEDRHTVCGTGDQHEKEDQEREIRCVFSHAENRGGGEGRGVGQDLFK